jgi:hypothetical protein
MATSNPTDGEDYTARRIRERAEHEAFWRLSEKKIARDLQPAEEDLPPNCRGGAHRWFRSPNVIDLVKIRKARAFLR